MTCRAQQFNRYLEGQGHIMTVQQNRVPTITLLFEVPFKIKLFHRNDHDIESPCREQFLGCYLEGQGHNIALQQKPVRLITLLFEVGFYNYLTKIVITMNRSL